MLQPFQRIRQVALADKHRRPLIRRQRRQPVAQIDAGRGRIARQHAGRVSDFEGGVPIHRQAALGQRHRRRHHLLQRQPAPGGVHLLVAGDRAGHRGRERAVDVAVVLHLWPAEQILRHPPGQRELRLVQVARRDRAEIHHLRRFLPGAMHQREADAANAGIPRLRRGQREGGGHRRIHRVAARIQNGNARFRRIPALGHHHAALAARRRLGLQPMFGHVRLQGEGHARLHPAFGLLLAHTRLDVDARGVGFAIELPQFRGVDYPLISRTMP